MSKVSRTYKEIGVTEESIAEGIKVLSIPRWAPLKRLYIEEHATQEKRTFSLFLAHTLYTHLGMDLG